MPWSGSFAELEHYLREFTNIGGDPPYDPVGVFSLFLALLDNLRAHAFEDELAELVEEMSAEQSAFLLRLAARVANERNRQDGEGT